MKPLCHLLCVFLRYNFAHLSSTARDKTCFEFMSIFDMGVGVSSLHMISKGPQVFISFSLK